MLRRDVDTLLESFAYDHLPEDLQGITKLLKSTAEALTGCGSKLTDTAWVDPEVVFGLESLLRAKDSFVRAELRRLSRGR